MSSRIVLIQFTPDKNGNICEDKSISIQDSFISHELLEKLTQNFELIEENIAEEYNSKESSIFEFFHDSEIEQVISFLEESFISSVSSSAKNFDEEEYINKQQIKLLRGEFRSLLNVIAIFELKNENFKDDKNTRVKVSR